MIKTIDDYVDKIHEKYNFLDKKTIRHIIRHGLLTYCSHNNHGRDIHIENDKFSMYTGSVFKDFPNNIRYVTRKRINKLRYRHCVEKPPYSGEYYFGLSEQEYQDYIKAYEPLAKKRLNESCLIKTCFLKKIRFFKLLKECQTHAYYKYHFAYKLPFEEGYIIDEENIEIDNYRMVSYRDEDNQIVNLEKNGKRNRYKYLW